MTATQAPNGKQQFADANGAPYAGGSVYMYIPGTSVLKPTWQDINQTILNTNPIVLDAAGRAIIWGVGAFRQVLYDNLGNLIWDQVIFCPPPSSAASENNEVWLTTDFGGVGDGATDNWNAMATAAAFCTQTGITLNIPPGNFKINTDGGTITLAYINIQGPKTSRLAAGNQTTRGAVFSFVGTTNSPFIVNAGVTIEGTVTFYPDQVDSPTPIVYPPTFAYDTTNGAVSMCYFRNNTIINAYRAITFNSVNGSYGHIWIEDNGIYGILTDIEFASNHEQIYIKHNDFTFGMYQGSTEGGLRGFSRANGTCIYYPKGDGLQILNNLIFGKKYGIDMAETGLVQDIMINLNYFGQCRYGIISNASLGADGQLIDFQIIGNNFTCFNSQDTTLQSNCLRLLTNKSGRESGTITANQFTSCTEDGVYISGDAPTRDYVFASNTHRNWGRDKAAGSYGAMNINGALTNVQVQGGAFYGEANAYTSGIIAATNNLNVYGAVFNRCFNAIKATLGRTIHQGNESYVTGDTVSDLITSSVNISLGNHYDKASGNTSRPAFAARSGSAQTFNSGTPAAMNFEIINYNYGSYWEVARTSTVRANSTGYVVGDVITTASAPTLIFSCTTAGTTDVSEPAGYSTATAGVSVADGTAIFLAEPVADLQAHFTAIQAGRYRFSWALQHDTTGTAGDKFIVALVPAIQTQARTYYVMQNGVKNSVSGEFQYDLAEGESVQLQIYREAGGTGAFVTTADATFNYITGQLVE